MPGWLQQPFFLWELASQTGYRTEAKSQGSSVLQIDAPSSSGVSRNVGAGSFGITMGSDRQTISGSKTVVCGSGPRGEIGGTMNGVCVARSIACDWDLVTAGGFVEKMRGGETFRLPGGLLKTLR